MISLKTLTKALFSLLLLGTVRGNDEANPESGETVMVGIDLGTTYSCVGVWQGERVEIVPNDQGNRITPSYVAFTKDGTSLIGDSAKNQAPLNPENTIFDSKRLLGRQFSDPEVKRDIAHWPFKVVQSSNGQPGIEIKVDGKAKVMAPEQISAMVLTKMKEIAENYLGKKVTHAVVTVPAYFNDAQRQATKDAGTIAGLKVARILNEPTAAAIAYGLDKKKEAKIIVFDLGGGTFDVSALIVDDGVFEVKAVNGNTHLGGQDFDNLLLEWAIDLIKTKYKTDLKGDNKAKARLRQELEKAKRTLSSETTATIEIQSIAPGLDFVETLTRAKFEELCDKLFKATLPPVEKALADAGWTVDMVNEVVLVGGSTRIPKVQKMLKDLFKGKELNKSIHPDEAVALGATYQAGVLSGKSKAENILVLDATPLSLGIETVGGVMTVLIPRNTVIPSKKQQIFSTASDNQDTVDITIYEGERQMAKDNHFLGHFYLRGIPLAPRGVPQIEVTFDVDANSILTVKARDMASGKEESINITADKRRLSDSEIQRMVKEAEENREKDMALKEKIEARNNLENYLYSLKSQVNDEKSMGAKLSEADKKSILDIINAKVKWLDENKEKASKEDFEEQKAAVEEVVKPIVSKIYQGGENASGTKLSDHEDL